MKSKLGTYVSFLLYIVFFVTVHWSGSAVVFWEISIFGLFGIFFGRHWLLNKKSKAWGDLIVTAFDLLWVSGSIVAAYFLFNETFGKAQGSHTEITLLKVLWLGPFVFFWGLRVSKALFDLHGKLEAAQPSNKRPAHYKAQYEPVRWLLPIAAVVVAPPLPILFLLLSTKPDEAFSWLLKTYVEGC